MIPDPSTETTPATPTHDGSGVASAAICSADRGRWERSEWPHPKFPNHLRPAALPDVIWIRIHTVFRGAQIEEVTGWKSLPPEAERCENPESSRPLSPVASISQNVEAWHPLLGAPLRHWLRFGITLRIRLGTGSGLSSAALFAFCLIKRVRIGESVDRGNLR